MLNLKDETPYHDLLLQNKYYFVPIVNVDTVAEIEKQFLETGKIVLMRKNQNLEKANA